MYAPGLIILRTNLGQILGRLRPMQATRQNQNSRLCWAPTAYRDPQAGSNPYAWLRHPRCMFGSASLSATRSFLGAKMGQTMRHSMPIHAHAHVDSRMQRNAKTPNLRLGRFSLSYCSTIGVCRSPGLIDEQAGQLMGEAACQTWLCA